MPAASRETDIYRRDAKLDHTLLTPAEREKLIEPYLPEPPLKPSSRRRKNGKLAGIPTDGRGHSRLGVRKFLKHHLHLLVYTIIHAVFSIYIRFRQAYHGVKDRILAILYYHHRTPELIQKDVKGLSRLPKHLSIILTLQDGGRGGAGLEALVDEVAEIAAWCACTGIPMLSVYEKTGILKGYIPATHRAISRKLSSYFGPEHPAVLLRAPHMPSIESAAGTPVNGTPAPSPAVKNLNILLLSAEDGRDSLVDLTKTLAEMSQRSKLSSKDISADLVDAEISESVMGEPDLLVLFGPTVELSGYPPWQVRLTEIFHVQDNQDVGYQVFLRALYNYANAQMRFGR
ncbi:putative NUS1 putative nuclear undecaprenyl pyrophosphate synthase [Venustampulla echinocandica]|uniref:ditrans,polycis-polyprenyl diphosphate synthase [(2E,6E)-farnesyldiphosphate specific] n=1 Tax=Venustampulla echinocandica TaxID=2656787 RepID=A0A370TSG0_9HELO|nr:putative NUS1 putative nuclear undecaprenyl pyrophosphate synthase [Venustampulla echinocandica]RDL38466.1 putative NUS1 putative nuclear undecaprenyl pyrophosphate synthase [Venustampulla echinocandica]